MRDDETYSDFNNLEGDRKIDISQNDLKVIIDKVLQNDHPWDPQNCKSWYNIENTVDWYKVGKHGILIIDGIVNHRYGSGNMISVLKELQLEHNFFFKKGGVYKDVDINYHARISNNYLSNGDGSFIKKDAIFEDLEDEDLF